MPTAESNISKQRVDKWLWAARFFKTRQLASASIKGGKVKLMEGTNRKRCKPSSDIKIGDQLEIQRGHFQFIVTILKLNQHRGSATIAQTLYQETKESLQQRADIAEQLKNQPRNPWGGRKPDKRTVRQNRDFKRQL